MSKEMKLTPELRFPQFLNDGDWDGDSLINIAKFRRGSFPQPYGLPEWYDDENGMPFIQVYDVGDDFRLKPATKSKISTLAAEQSVFIEKGTVIITIQGSIGRVAITQYDAYIDRTLLIFQEFYSDIDKTFFAYVLFLLFEIEKQKAPGGIIKTITKEVLSDFVISFPKLPEQQKIASCLSSLDELLAAHNEKLDALKNHKKGLMQNLFPQEGETVPKVRFSEFEGDGDWEETALNKISEGIFDGTHQTPKYKESGIPFFSVENIVSGNKNKFISREDYLFETRNNKPEYGDVLITRIGSIGISKVVDWDYEFSVYVTLAVVKKSDMFDSEFLASYVQSGRFQKEILSRSLLNAAPQKINMNELRECEVLLPPKYQEQQKIASCLSALDELINAQAEKIEQLQQLKKGLMQGLFPKIVS
jgi:type I restriction enzyme S subunit